MPSKAARRKNYTVFISHSSKDRWIARQIALSIEREGRAHKIKTVLSERDIAAGDDITDWIKNQIIESDELLVLLSSYSIKRHWVILEIGVALGREVLIAPITDKITPKEIPDAISKLDAKDLNDFDNYLKQLMVRASRPVGRKRK
jgi:hypothetical protein